nr:hypothetical protein CFP56_00145 [Quercus suber]
MKSIVGVRKRKGKGQQGGQGGQDVCLRMSAMRRGGRVRSSPCQVHRTCRLVLRPGKTTGRPAWLGNQSAALTGRCRKLAEKSLSVQEPAAGQGF